MTLTRLRVGQRTITHLSNLVKVLISQCAGLVVTFWSLKALAALIPANMPRLRELQVDGPALGTALVLAVGTALVFGLIPAWHASRTSIGNALKQAGTGATIGHGWRRYRRVLVLAEVALSVALLEGAGLMIKSRVI
jgi:putative ABC transport system permease protein